MASYSAEEKAETARYPLRFWFYFRRQALREPPSPAVKKDTTLTGARELDSPMIPRATARWPFVRDMEFFRNIPTETKPMRNRSKALRRESSPRVSLILLRGEVAAQRRRDTHALAVVAPFRLRWSTISRLRLSRGKYFGRTCNSGISTCSASCRGTLWPRF